MWRGFGKGVARVAIVFRVPYYAGGGMKALKTIFSPVAYFDAGGLRAEFLNIFENIEQNLDFLRSLDRSLFVESVLSMFVSGAACLKHEGFHEEREWRAVHLPKLLKSQFMKASNEIIGGVPQLVYHLPLDAAVSAELDFTHLFDRLIIGPSEFPWVMYEAFVDCLLQIGISDAADRVHVSGIPFRG